MELPVCAVLGVLGVVAMRLYAKARCLPLEAATPRLRRALWLFVVLGLLEILELHVYLARVDDLDTRQLLLVSAKLLVALLFGVAAASLWSASSALVSSGASAAVARADRPHEAIEPSDIGDDLPGRCPACGAKFEPAPRCPACGLNLGEA